MFGPYIINNSNKHVQNPPKPRENLHIDTYVHYHGKMVELQFIGSGNKAI